MDLVVDTSVLVAVLTGEQERAAILKVTQGVNLLAPASVHWEVGNAFSAMLKRRRISITQVRSALQAYAKIPIRFVETDLNEAMDLADQYNLYAYDAYLLACARTQRAELISLDKALLAAATMAGIASIEVPKV